MTDLILPADFGNTPKKDLLLPDGFTSLVIHCCCAPCAGAMFECFKVHNIKPFVFFFNPNIHPQAEYVKRRDELIKLCTLLNFPVTVGDYEPRKWFDAIKGLEQEPERGQRCSVCFAFRLSATALFAKEVGATHFTTTLATSRWKNKAQIDDAGFKAQSFVNDEVKYWAEDWRKKGMVTRRDALVKKFNFYNQQYCGCVFSKENTSYQK